MANLPADAEDDLAARFWNELNADGRMEKLRTASHNRPWELRLGSWDAECEKKGFRYTVCIEATEGTDFSSLELEIPLFTIEIGASDWMCFEMTQAKYDERFWKDNPYRMMKLLGYKFYARDASVGLHFDAYPPDFDMQTNPNMEFWMTVTKRQLVEIRNQRAKFPIRRAGDF